MVTDTTLEDKMRIAIADLIRAQPLLLSAITELERQGYTTEAATVSSVLTSLISATEAVKTAVSS